MSTSLSYQAHGLKGIGYLRTEIRDGSIVFHGVVSSGHYRCSQCRSRRVVRSSGVYREFKLSPTGTWKNLLRLFITRLECKQCGAIRQVELSFAAVSRCNRNCVFRPCTRKMG